jgi:hypothetical protein
MAAFGSHRGSLQTDKSPPSPPDGGNDGFASMMIPESALACPCKALAVPSARDELHQMHVMIEPLQAKAEALHRAQAADVVEKLLLDIVEKVLLQHLNLAAVAPMHIETLSDHPKVKTPRRNRAAMQHRDRQETVFDVNPCPEQAQLESSCDGAASSSSLVPDRPSDSTDAHIGAYGAAAVPQDTVASIQATDNYERMLQHLRLVDPLIVGIRFELLMDGAPDQLRGHCESQLHVVVVRQVSWPARHYIACLRLVALLSLMLFILSYLFGPISGFIALYFLNSEQLVREFAGLVIGATKRHDDQHLPSFVLLSSCLAIVPLVLGVTNFFDEYWLLRFIIWFLENSLA